MKTVIFDPAARKTIRGLDLETKREIGALLLSLQRGELLSMPQSRPLKAVDNSAFELRLKDKNGIFRVIYVYFDGERILVPHAFSKKTQKTPKKEIDTAKKRLKGLINEIE